jgi:membrane protease YdiL (CAAX protease family)
MRHLTRRFSGNMFLYVVIATIITQLILGLSVNFGLWFESFQQNATLIILLTQLLIFIPPIFAIVVSHYPWREALRIRAFPLSQFWFTIGITICACFALSTIGILIDQLQNTILYPDFTASSSYFNIGTPSILYIFTGGLIPAILEGAVYCGAILSGFHQMKPLKACLAVGLMYALVQFNLASFITYTLLGFVLCYITLRTNSIFPGIIASFLYLLMNRYTLTGRLYYSTLSPLGIGENTAAIIIAVVFILLGGWLLVKMPDKKYENGNAKRALDKLREIFPGLFSISGLDRPEEANAPEDMPAEEELPGATEAMTTNIPAVPAVAEDEGESVGDMNAEVEADEMPDPKENNPMIVGVFISAIATALLFGFSVLYSLGFFGSY